jgi:predicted regulator of Ras-like GTPase activity (Roadblock/LC7/MglB family)
MLEYEKGTVMMNRVGEDAVLLVVLAPNATIGKVRYDVRKTIPELSAAL